MTFLDESSRITYKYMAEKPYFCQGKPMSLSNFEWDETKSLENQKKHSVSFEEAQHAFLDQNRVIARDIEHSSRHKTRYYCFGKDQDGYGILTVRFT